MPKEDIEMNDLANPQLSCSRTNVPRESQAIKGIK